MGPKLIIVLAVQSVLVVGIGGVALGMSAAEPQVARHKVKKKASVAEEEHGNPAGSKRAQSSTSAARQRAAHAGDHPEANAPVHGPDHADSGSAEHASGAQERQQEQAGVHHEERIPSHAEQPANGEETQKPMPTAVPFPKDSLEAFAWLHEGNTRWAQGHVKSRDLVTTRELSAAHFAPWAVVVSCSDGRAAPESVFDTGPGALVTLRWPTLAPSSSALAMVERTMTDHRPQVVVVLGHRGCAVSALDPAEAVTRFTTQMIENKVVRRALEAKKTLVLRAIYDLTTGQIRWLDSEEPHAEAPLLRHAHEH